MDNKILYILENYDKVKNIHKLYKNINLKELINEII